MKDVAKDRVFRRARGLCRNTRSCDTGSEETTSCKLHNFICQAFGRERGTPVQNIAPVIRRRVRRKGEGDDPEINRVDGRFVEIDKGRRSTREF